jgi:hypothetical protein
MWSGRSTPGQVSGRDAPNGSPSFSGRVRGTTRAGNTCRKRTFHSSRSCGQPAGSRATCRSAEMAGRGLGTSMFVAGPSPPSGARLCPLSQPFGEGASRSARRSCPRRPRRSRPSRTFALWPASPSTPPSTPRSPSPFGPRRRPSAAASATKVVPAGGAAAAGAAKHVAGLPRMRPLSAHEKRHSRPYAAHFHFTFSQCGLTAQPSRAPTNGLVQRFSTTPSAPGIDLARR